MSFVWTDKNVFLLRQMMANGHSASQIGSTIGTTRNAVIGKAHRMQIRLANGKAPRQFKPKEVVIKQAQASKTVWTEERIARAVELWETGMLSKDIAADLGCTPNAFLALTDRFRARFPKRGHHRAGKSRSAAVGEAQVTAADMVEIKAAKTFAFDSVPFLLPEFPSVRFVDLKAQDCKFPVSNDEGEDMLCCGARRITGPYCGVHAVVARGRGTRSEQAAHKGRVWR
jgi:GcrA cell cycle regulator